VIDEQPEARESLDEIMEETQYPHRHAHRDIIDSAFILSIVDTESDVLAGYCWFYRLEENIERYSLHLLVLPNYRKRFFSRTIVNSVLNLMWVLGCNTVVVENTNQELLLRVGGYMNEEDEVLLQLPHEWR
jgi:hypothetical protein